MTAVFLSKYGVHSLVGLHVLNGAYKAVGYAYHLSLGRVAGLEVIARKGGRRKMAMKQ